MSDRVAVMYLGRIVEIAPAEALFDQPLHPYTESLLSAVPQPDPRLQRSREVIKVQGELPDPTAVPDGCPFRTRCLYAEDQCAEPPPLVERDGDRAVACHRVEELDLQGVHR